MVPTASLVTPRNNAVGRPIRPARDAGLFAIPVLVALLPIVLAGCSLFGLSWPPTSPDASDAPSPTPLPGLSTPAPSGSGSAEPGTIRDVASGFSLRLPSGWRALAAGDDGWVEVYGAHDSAPERDVADGTIQDYALPLPQNDDRSLNVAVYVRRAPAGTTLDGLADEYTTTLRDSPRFTKIERADVGLAAGRSILLSAVRSGTEAAKPHDDRLEAYLLLNDSRAYYFVFVCSEATSDRYAPIFRAAADSIRFASP
jgi:hypothetical protein